MAMLILSLIGFVIVFIFFLVIVRTLGSIINYLTKIEFWVNEEHKFEIEQIDIRRALESEEDEKEKEKEELEKKNSNPLDFLAGKKK